MKITDWQNCYDLGWSDLLIPEAYSHPAKFSRNLIFRIVEYLLKSEMVKPGDTVIDPFGGVGLGALPCLLNGLNWIGNELEEKFVELGRKNIELWNTKFSSMPKWTGSATLFQGDSRKLAEVIQQAGGLVSSPPFLDNNVNIGGVGNTPGRRQQIHNSTKRDNSYGTTPGQLAGLPATVPGTGKGRPLVVSSPPFAGNTGGRGEASRNGIDPGLFDRHQGAMVGGIGSAGNLAGMKPGALVTSPPFERADNRGNRAALDTLQEMVKRDGNGHGGKLGPSIGQDYGNTEGQIGNDTGETFWSAAAVIISQCYQLLPPGAPAVFVVKSFVRDGAIVDFPGQWQQLCESCGFETVEIIRAWLVKDKGTQMDLNGNGIKQRIERKSFFRRTGEQNTRARSGNFHCPGCTGCVNGQAGRRKGYKTPRSSASAVR